MSRQRNVNLRLTIPTASINYICPRTPMADIPFPLFSRGKEAQETVTVQLEPPREADSTQVPPSPRNRSVQESASIQVDPPFPEFPGNRVDQRSASTRLDPPFPGNGIGQGSDSTQVDPPFPGNRIDNTRAPMQVDPPSPRFPGSSLDQGSASQLVDAAGTGSNRNDAGEHNHTSCQLTPDMENKMNNVVLTIGELSLTAHGLYYARLEELRTQCRDFVASVEGVSSKPCDHCLGSNRPE